MLPASEIPTIVKISRRLNAIDLALYRLNEITYIRPHTMPKAFESLSMDGHVSLFQRPAVTALHVPFSEVLILADRSKVNCDDDVVQIEGIYLNSEQMFATKLQEGR